MSQHKETFGSTNSGALAVCARYGLLGCALLAMRQSPIYKARAGPGDNLPGSPAEENKEPNSYRQLSV